MFSPLSWMPVWISYGDTHNVCRKQRRIVDFATLICCLPLRRKTCGLFSSTSRAAIFFSSVTWGRPLAPCARRLHLSGSERPISESKRDSARFRWTRCERDDEQMCLRTFWGCIANIEPSRTSKNDGDPLILLIGLTRLCRTPKSSERHSFLPLR